MDNGRDVFKEVGGLPLGGRCGKMALGCGGEGGMLTSDEDDREWE